MRTRRNCVYRLYTELLKTFKLLNTLVNGSGTLKKNIVKHFINLLESVVQIHRCS